MVIQSQRGLPLVGFAHEINTLPDISMVTVEDYCKWYGLCVVHSAQNVADGAPCVEEFGFGFLDSSFEHRYGFGSAYLDHVPNPRAVIRLAKSRGWMVQLQALEMIVGRWELEAMQGHSSYDDLLEALYG